MKPLIFSILVLLLGSGCAPVLEEQTTTATSTTIPDVQLTQEPQVYVSFIQNVHDWVFPENSLATIHRLIDLHELYKIPMDLYLDDQVVQEYLKLEPSIFDRLKSSEYVAISYHIRPPHPVYEGFDMIGLANMSIEDQYAVLYQYETHRLDLATGEYTEEPGGYAYLKELIGYAPRVVTHTTSREYGEALSRVYEEMGALFAVVHGKEKTLNDLIYGLHTRPEQVEVKLYEDSYAKGFDAEERFAKWTADFDGTSDYFINLKYHENNFYTQGTPFEYVYVNSPPFDLSAGDKTVMKSKQAQDEKWKIYEEALQYVSEHSDELTAITSIDLEKMLEE